MDEGGKYLEFCWTSLQQAFYFESIQWVNETHEIFFLDKNPEDCLVLVLAVTISSSSRSLWAADAREDTAITVPAAAASCLLMLILGTRTSLHQHSRKSEFLSSSDTIHQ